MEHHHTTRVPAMPLERIYIDFKGPLPINPVNYQEDSKYLLTILDNSSRFLNAVPVSQNGAIDALNALKRHWIQIIGPPSEIIADNVPFNSKEFRKFTEDKGIKLQNIAPYAHFSSAVESKQRELDVKLRAFKHSQNLSWTDSLHLALVSMNNATNSATGEAPSILLFKSKIDPLKRIRITKSDDIIELIIKGKSA
eukprot:NODE_809_length_3752_cov_0.454421.p1 type:complete len:196 gc:universal NODE_809_length_3752_cov_0.454421:1624-2211(+)